MVMRFDKLKMQMDLQIIVSIINKYGNGNVSGWSIIKKIYTLLSLEWTMEY
jgi:hypothetical protein